MKWSCGPTSSKTGARGRQEREGLGIGGAMRGNGPWRCDIFGMWLRDFNNLNLLNIAC
jgi:hypothetical protein